MSLPEHTLDYIREQLLHTLSVESFSEYPKEEEFTSEGSGEEEFVIEYITPDEHETEREDELTGAVFDIEFVQCSPTRKSGGSRCLLTDDSFKLTRLVKCLFSMVSGYRNLLIYGYGERLEPRHFNGAVIFVWAEFLKIHTKKFRKKKEQKLAAMATLATQKFRSDIQNQEFDISPSKLIRLLDVNEHTWRRDWLPFWRDFLGILDSQDKAALTDLNCRLNTANPVESQENEDTKPKAA